MRRRLVLLLASTALASGTFGAIAAHAEPSVPAPTVNSTSGDYWACATLNYVDVGTCVRNPLPDPSTVPSVRQVIYDVSGVNV